MTIDDELLVELIKLDDHAHISKDSFLRQIASGKIIGYKLEESTSYWERHGRVPKRDQYEDIGETVKITPDITLIQEPNLLALSRRPDFEKIAIELENDIQWDFQKSLQQVKKYASSCKFSRVVIIIPEEYQKFAVLYANESLDVALWKTDRIWQCMKCGNKSRKEGPIPPKCEKCKKNTEHRLTGLENTTFRLYPKGAR